MAKVQIERIRIKNFRGIADVDIPISRKNLVFYGENGSGKSSFVDAFEYLLTGQIERFDRQDVKINQSIPFLKHVSNDSSVKLECHYSGKHNLVVEIGYPNKKYTCTDNALSEWVEQLVAYPPILRRSQIVGFIEEKGASRLKRLSQIIGLEQVDNAKSVWDTEKRKRQESLKSARSALERLERRQQDLTSNFEGDTAFERINNRLISINMSPIKTISDIRLSKEQLSRQVSETDIGQRLQLAKDLQELLIEFDRKLGEFIDDYTSDFFPEWQRYTEQKSNLQNELLRKFLAEGQRILLSGKDEFCPFCEQQIDRTHVELRITERIETLEAIRVLTEQVEKKRRVLHDQVTSCLALLKRISEARLDITLPPVQTIQNILTDFSSRNEQSLGAVSYLTSDELSSNLFSGRMETGSIHNVLDLHIAELAKNINDTVLAETLAWLGSIEECMLSLEVARVELNSAEIRAKNIEKMCSALLDAREQHLDSINNAIATDFNAFYQMLHPDEGYGDIKLVFESAGKGLGITANYHGIKSHPLGFYSEGHLDTLGISVFLAYIRRFSQAKLLILDDIMTTIDGSHRLRLAHLLKDEFRDYQIILTTHDRLWMEEIQRTMTDLQTIQLTWTITGGVQYRELLEQNWDNYIEMAKTDPQNAIVKCAIDFEKFLNIMRFNFSLAIPAKPGDQYTIGDMQNSFFKWLKDKRIVGHPEARYEAKWEKLRDWLNTHIVLRNLAGAHYNEWAQNLSSGEASDFVQLVRETVSLFDCPNCNRNWVRFDPNSKVIYCNKCSGKPNAPIWKTSG